MPNWCSSTISVHADRSVLDKLRREVPIFALSLVEPVPPILAGFATEHEWHPGDDGDFGHYRWIPMRLFARDGEVVQEPVAERELAELMSLFGATNAEDWKRQAWGTGSDMLFPGTWSWQDDVLTTYGETPWSPPNIAVQTLSRRYPTARFELSFHIEYDGSGCLVYVNGAEVENSYTEYDWDAIYADEGGLRDQETPDLAGSVDDTAGCN